MSKIWLTSDLHLNHQNILKYEPVSRPFETVEEMNETIISRWNEVVDDNDIVYVLGDLSMGTNNNAGTAVRRLKGRITLIRGNHDTAARRQLYQKLGIEIKDIEYLNYKGKYFILNHFPLGNEEFSKMIFSDNAEVVLLYGHIHSNAPKGFYNNTYHVGVDTNELRPISIEQIWKECNQ